MEDETHDSQTVEEDGPPQAGRAVGDFVPLIEGSSTTDNVEEAHTSLSFLKEFIFDKFPASKPTDTLEDSVPPAYTYDAFYPSHFARQPKENKDLCYCKKLEDVCAKTVASWLAQAAKDFKRLNSIFPNRSAFYRATHPSLGGAPQMSLLEKDLSNH